MSLTVLQQDRQSMMFCVTQRSWKEMFPENSGDFVFSLNISTQNIVPLYSILSSEDSHGNCQLCLWRNHFTHPFNVITSGMESDRQQAATAREWERELWDKDTRAALCKALPTEAFSFSNPCPKGLAHFLQHLGMRRANWIYIESENILNLRLVTSRP